MARQPLDARAPFYLGTVLYAHHVYDAAIELWERSAALDPAFATVQRNLGLAYMNQRGDGASAQASYARAFALDPTDSRVFFELDQLDKKVGKSPAERLAQLSEAGQRLMREVGIEPHDAPIRGGTDGSQLTERGLPTPNIFCGMINVHGPLEFCSVQDMSASVDVLVHLAELWAQ